VRKLRDELHVGGDGHKVFGKSKRIVLLSDAQWESKEDTEKMAKLQVTFDGIGGEPIWAKHNLQIGGELVFGGEEWREHWAEG
jgi:hypothetical protein